MKIAQSIAYFKFKARLRRLVKPLSKWTNEVHISCKNFGKCMLENFFPYKGFFLFQINESV